MLLNTHQQTLLYGLPLGFDFYFSLCLLSAILSKLAAQFQAIYSPLFTQTSSLDKHAILKDIYKCNKIILRKKKGRGGSLSNLLLGAVISITSAY